LTFANFCVCLTFFLKKSAFKFISGGNMVFYKYVANNFILFLKVTIIFVFLSTIFSCTKFPLPDPTKKDTLLIIPVSITLVHNSKDRFGLTLVRENDEKKLKFTFSQSNYKHLDYILIENIEPGTYYFHSLSFFTRSGRETEKKNYHDGLKGFDRRDNRGNFEFSKNPIRLELKDNQVTIPKFKIEFWEEKKNGRCCSVYLYLINNIDDLFRNQLIDKLNDSENFNKWKLD